jgi:hypothetical protein
MPKCDCNLRSFYLTDHCQVYAIGFALAYAHLHDPGGVYALDIFFLLKVMLMMSQSIILKLATLLC